MTDATNLYLAGDYATKHPDWHLGDAPGKADDLFPVLITALRRSHAATDTDRPFRLADVGAGVGGVLAELIQRLQKDEARSIEGIGFEISQSAIEAGRQRFPNLDLRQKFFESSDGPFDAVLLVDVLEHVENPWELLRIAATTSNFLIVRQPLLESFSTFRHNNYRDQREHWGHIGFFNYRSFLNMIAATGWTPLRVELLPSWQLAGNRGGRRPSWIHRALVRFNRPLASYLLSGFYLIGAFERVRS